MQRADRYCSAGFTLIEVIVALVIGGGAVLLAGSMLAATSDQTRLVGERVRATDASRGSERLLRRLVGQMTWSKPSEPAARGSAASLRFIAWCDMPRGWEERCTVELELPADEDRTNGILVRLSTGEELRLLGGRRVTGFLYLGRVERGGRWTDRWIDGASLPPAIGVVVDGDTLTIRIGDRG